MQWIITFFLSYLIGSFSTAYFLGKYLLKKDMSQEGSGNLGAMNSYKTSGYFFGITVFLIDIFKGAGAILLIQLLYSDRLLLYLGAIGVILGHNFSIYIGFKGGKGLASMVGILAVINPLVLLILALLAFTFRQLSNNNGVSAILTVIPFTFIFALITGDWRSVPFSLVLTIIVLIKHRPEEYEALLRFLRIKKQLRE